MLISCCCLQTRSTVRGSNSCGRGIPRTRNLKIRTPLIHAHHIHHVSNKLNEKWNVSQKEHEHRVLSNADTKYDALTQISAIKTTQNDCKWHIYNTILWKLHDVTHFPSLFYVHACRSGKRAINNIVGSAATGIRLRHEYAKHLSTILRYNGHRHIGGSSTIHRRLTPLPKEPSRIFLMYLILLASRIIHLHVPADSLCLSSFNFFLMSAGTSHKTFLFLNNPTVIGRLLSR